jgi:hypothetical protein
MKVKQFNHNSSKILAYHSTTQWRNLEILFFLVKGAFTPNVKSVLSENLGGILGGTQF